MKAARNSLLYLVLFILVVATAQPVIAADYSADISSTSDTHTAYDFEKIVIPLTLVNTGSKPWDSTASNGQIFISYHLRNLDGSLVKWDNVWTSFGKEILPGKTVYTNMTVDPIPPGKYILQVDIVLKDKFWFSEHGLLF